MFYYWLLIQTLKLLAYSYFAFNNRSFPYYFVKLYILHMLCILHRLRVLIKFWDSILNIFILPNPYLTYYFTWLLFWTVPRGKWTKRLRAAGFTRLIGWSAQLAGQNEFDLFAQSCASSRTTHPIGLVSL